ncbi:hypothetical protein QYM36_012864 [Artemia franciscana]|uniref:C2H2-type domain-containing protein n=1 Tax=Artemia franciscana TaxID=6661 RepID=A0AA88L3Z0_ARTSF|nr:hypothetical protein QYM36_012864 [Artemia franciscana]
MNSMSEEASDHAMIFANETHQSNLLKTDCTSTELSNTNVSSAEETTKQKEEDAPNQKNETSFQNDEKRSKSNNLMRPVYRKPFNCDVCKRSFSFKSNLARHLESHTREKPFKLEDLPVVIQENPIENVHRHNWRAQTSLASRRAPSMLDIQVDVDLPRARTQGQRTVNVTIDLDRSDYFPHSPSESSPSPDSDLGISSEAQGSSEAIVQCGICFDTLGQMKTAEPINIFQGQLQNGDMNPAIRLSYHRGVHYNSIVDPFKATIGVGLGLPGHVPGAADRSLVRDAISQSEETEIERTMMEDKIKATDWEATNEAIEEHIARESYIEWLRENERNTKHSRGANLKSPDIRSPRHRGESSTKLSPVHNFGTKNSPKLTLGEKRSSCQSPQPGHSREHIIESTYLESSESPRNLVHVWSL